MMNQIPEIPKVPVKEQKNYLPLVLSIIGTIFMCLAPAFIGFSFLSIVLSVVALIFSIKQYKPEAFHLVPLVLSIVVIVINAYIVSNTFISFVKDQYYSNTYYYPYYEDYEDDFNDPFWD